MLARLRERPLRASESKAVEPKEFLRLDSSIRKLASKMRNESSSLQASWSTDDLIQEIYLRALITIEQYSGKSSLRTWTMTVAHNHLVSMAREASRRPTPSGDAIWSTLIGEPFKRLALRSEIRSLLRWLRKNPDEVTGGWEVLTLLLKTQGDWSYVALAMAIHTRDPWTTETVRRTVRRIEQTDQGKELCDSIGLVR